ncbi:ubiquitin-like domain-containing protein [Aquipuribacter nitratireducens]|uniref:Ubiquitin-like domain-containing protein n=1 Tax=Aquipuribacter nitratireducens TaxID=650104 RepID=A0ABW0GPI7_9MICO
MTFSSLPSRLAGRVRPVIGVVTRRSRVVAAAQAAVLTLLVAGVAGWSVLDRTVTLSVDGEAQQVRILGSEVSDVLDAAGVEVGSRDLVSPAVDETVADGDEVVVRYARQLTVADPTGEERTYWTTELTVEDALAAVGLRHGDAWLSASRSAGIGREGLSLTMSMPKNLTVVADGETLEVVSPAPTVQDLLQEVGVTVRAQDRMDAEPTDVLVEGQVVTVNRVTVHDEDESVVIEAGSRTVEDDDLYEGESEVREEGRDGTEVVTYRITTVDGEVESKKEVARVVETEAVDRVVAKGTKERPAPEPVRASSSGSSGGSSSGGSSGGSGGSSGGTPPAPSSGSVDSLNWAALAQCESGGNPSIVSSNGLYHGLYQFDRGTWQSVGGSGVASDAPASEQTARAKMLYASRGASPWPHCGSRLFS